MIIIEKRFREEKGVSRACFMELLKWTGNKIMGTGKRSKMNRVILEKKIWSNWSMKVN